MSKIVYFVVGVDLAAKSAFIDDDAYMMRYSSEEQVFDDDTLEWETDKDQVLYKEALAILNSKPIAKDGN